MTTTNHIINWTSNLFGHIGHTVTADRTLLSCHITGKRGSWDARVMLPTETGLSALGSDKTMIDAHHTNLDEAKAWCAEVIKDAIEMAVAA
jgi:hypothetical protein